jgi:hypothetical protein
MIDSTSNGEGVSAPYRPLEGAARRSMPTGRTPQRVQVRVDLPTVPAIRAAGTVGAWLYLCAVCAVTERGGDTFIGDRDLRALVDWEDAGAKPRATIARCVAAGLLAATKDGYLVILCDGVSV